MVMLRTLAGSDEAPETRKSGMGNHNSITRTAHHNEIVVRATLYKITSSLSYPPVGESHQVAERDISQHPL